jgi:hypothetical protein
MKPIAAWIDRPKGFVGDARLYRIDPPYCGHAFVVVSAITYRNSEETAIFYSDGAGNVLDWSPLTGTYTGGLLHEKALRGLGYSVQE